MKKIALASILSLAFAGTALANPEAKKEVKPADKAAPAKSEAAPPAPPPAPEMKPAAEMEQLKGMIGTFKCTGKVTAMGQEMPMEAVHKGAMDLDGYWVAASLTEKKKKGAPSYSAKDMLTYDAAAKSFVRISTDNMGGWSQSTSKGWNGDKMEWTGTAKTMGQDMKVVDTVTKAADGKSFQVAGHYLAGAEKPVAWDMTCKK